MVAPTVADDEILIAAARPVVGDVGQGWSVLAVDERERARTYRIDEDRRRFVVGRHVLRTVCGRALGRDPTSLTIHIGAHGKPCFAEPHAELRFNIAHGGGLVLVGFAWRQDIGVDVEAGDRRADADALVARYGNVKTQQSWHELAAAERSSAFLAWWTRAEAALKALGTGLTLSPRELAIDPRPGVMEQYVPYGSELLRVMDLRLPLGHRGAVCARAGCWKPRLVDLGDVPVGPEPR